MVRTPGKKWWLPLAWQAISVTFRWANGTTTRLWHRGSWGGQRPSLGGYVTLRPIRRRHPALGSAQRPFVLATLGLTGSEIGRYLTRCGIEDPWPGAMKRHRLFEAFRVKQQLDERVQQAIVGNVGTLVAFRMGVRDAKVLAEAFFPEYSSSSMLDVTARWEWPLLARGSRLC
jgi:hypothetical protein